MGEVPVLLHGARKLTQSGVCLTYLARRSGKFLPAGEDEEEGQGGGSGHRGFSRKAALPPCGRLVRLSPSK